MISYLNKGLWVKNTKTGNTGTIISQYVNLSNGKPMVEVAVLGIASKKAYWMASAVEDLYVSREAEGLVNGVVRGGTVYGDEFRFHSPHPVSVPVDQVKELRYHDDA